MATAVKNPMETTAAAPDPQFRLLRASVVGALYLIVCLLLVFYGIPYVWKAGVTPWLGKLLGSFVDVALLGVTMIAAAVGLLIAGITLAGSRPPDGLRAGVFSILVLLLASLLLAVGVGQLLENY